MNSVLTQLEKRPRFAPIRNMTPDKLIRILDAFEQGYLAEAALAWDTIEKRDDTIKSVAPKRKKAVARHGWEVIVLPNLPCSAQAEALRHKEALEYFYTNLTCVNALDGNERGGFKLLVRQMMDSVGKRYAVHEIVWRLEPGRTGVSPVSSGVPPNDSPSSFTSLPSVQNSGSQHQPFFSSSVPSAPSVVKNSSPLRLSAQFRFVPLWFFENTTGSLRFLRKPYALQGEPLQPGAWMVTVGEGLMTACSVAWMHKHLPLQDWLDFSQKYAHPGLLASTTAERNSSEWNYLEQALDDFLTNLSAVTSSTESIKLLDLKGGGDLPYEPLISRMDRLITALWRGADLSTLSREQGYGASLQSGESDILEQDDAELISETLQTSVDRYVIEYLFGQNVKPLAAIKLLVTPKLSTPQDLQIDQFLINHGARLAVNDALARYGRAEANPGEPALERPSREPTLPQVTDTSSRDRGNTLARYGRAEANPGEPYLNKSGRTGASPSEPASATTGYENSQAKHSGRAPDPHWKYHSSLPTQKSVSSEKSVVNNSPFPTPNSASSTPPAVTNSSSPSVNNQDPKSAPSASSAVYSSLEDSAPQRLCD